MSNDKKLPKRYFVSLDFPRGVYPAGGKRMNRKTVRGNRTANPPTDDSTDHHWHKRRPPPFPSLF